YRRLLFRCRRSLWSLRGLAGVIGNDASDGGEDFLHRGLLRLRRLRHCPKTRHATRSPRGNGRAKADANHCRYTAYTPEPDVWGRWMEVSAQRTVDMGPCHGA